MEELASLGKMVLPIIITTLLLHSKSIISMLFLGHLGDTELAGGSLSISFANITGYSILKGLAMGMEPICYQAYGRKRWEIIIQTYRKTLFLLLLVSLPISLLWLNMEFALLWLGQDRNIELVAKIYIIYSIPDLVLQAHFHPLRIFLLTQNINMPLTLSALCAMILHLPLNYFLIMYLNMGVKGVPLATAWFSLNLNLGLVLYLFLSKRSLIPWDRAVNITCYQTWQPLLTLAGSSTVSVCLEWWWYEIMSIFCGWLSNPQENMAAMGILMQITSLLYVFPKSLRSGLSMLVGQELGGNQPHRARHITIAGLTVALLWGFLVFAFTVAVRNVCGNIYTHEPHILQLASTALPTLGFCELWNSPQTAASGILIGYAQPKVGCWVNFVSFYLIGLPVAALLSFIARIGFMGLWFGLAAAEVSCLCMMVCILMHTDWTNQAARTKELTQASFKINLEANLLV